MRVFDTERQEWAGSRRERLFHPDQYLDVRRQKAIRRKTAIVLAVAGLTFGVWALAWKDEPEPYRSFTAAGSDTAKDSSDGSGSGDGSGDASEGSASPAQPSESLPAGYESQEDPEGFRVALPTGWERDSRSSQYGIDVVDYRSPDGTRRLQVFQVMETSPYESLQVAQVEARKLDGYEAVSLTEVPGGTGQDAEHEYRADEVAGEQGGGTRHVIDHRFEAADGERYALVAYGSDADGPEDERELVDTALLWFCPPGTQCETPGG
ncbi:hypothetical protein ACH4Y0_26435 [Streptomyces sp. NPDC020707]|jgi:hypothetical protein|uniref:hypothetical protein n=1 Tax=Streptomyces sp. NPDC020707 TaxID=3365084 RepID=UPI0037AC466B